MDIGNQNKLTSGRLRRPLLGALLLLFLTAAAFVFWRSFLQQTTFAKNLPADALLYVSLALPNKIIDQLPGEAIIVKEALAQFNNRLEFSRLADGTWLAKTRLRDPAAWESFASRHSELKLEWQMVGKDIYISNQADMMKYLGSHESFLASALKRAKIGRGAVVAWLANADWVAEFPAYKNLLSGLNLPVGMVARDYGDYWQWSFGNPVNGERLKVSKALSSQNSLAGRLNDFSKVNGREWMRLFGEDWPLLLDMAPFGDKLNGYSADFFADALNKDLNFTGQKWLVKMQPKPGASPVDIMAPLKQAAADWFSLAHPLSVEHILADGSKMTELRADSSGLEWQTENGVDYLRGQGEDSGVYLSNLPGQEILLSNSGIFIRDYLETRGNFSLAGIAETVCLAPENSILRLSLPGLMFSVDQDDNLQLCTFFR